MPIRLPTRLSRSALLASTEREVTLLRGLRYLRVGHAKASAVEGNRATANGSLPQTAGRGGAALSYSKNSANFMSAPCAVSAPSSTALAFFHYPAAAASEGIALIGAYKYFGSGLNKSQYLSVDVGVLSAYSTSSNDWDAAAWTLPSTDRDYVAMGTFQNGGGRRLWLNGVLVATTAAARAPSGIDTILEGAYVDPGPTHYSAMRGRIYAAAWWTRVLTDAEIRFVSANPTLVLSRLHVASSAIIPNARYSSASISINARKVLAG